MRTLLGLLSVALVACGTAEAAPSQSPAVSPAAVQSCRIALGSPEGCLVLTGSCSCVIAGPDAVISFPASVSTASVAWVNDTTNERSIVTAKTTVQSGAVHLSFAVSGSAIRALDMAGWWWDITAQ